MRIYLDSAVVIYTVEQVLPYAEIFDGAIEEIIPLFREVVDLATKVRAQYSFKAPDALHLGAALWSKCDVFMTNDHRLDRFGELAIEVVDR